MFTSRLNQLKEQIKKGRLDAVFISSVSNISYLTGYTNFSEIEREVYLLIGEDFQYLITDGRYAQAVKSSVPHFSIFERGHKSQTEDLFKNIKEQIKIIGIEENNLTVSEYKFIRKHFPKTKHIEVENLRSIKTKDEILKISKACQIGDLAFDFIIKNIKDGISEKEVAWNLEKFIKDHRAEISFPTIVAFGKNSAIPHHQTGDTVLEKKDGQFVLLDFGVKFENYCSDMTRTIFFGNPSRKQKEIYETVLNAQKQAIDFINSSFREGKQIKAAKVDKAARDYIISKGYLSIPHSLGHGIGLQVHEYPHISPKSKEILKEGMVFSIEPGIYILDYGGVRIEDLFVLEMGNIRQITSSTNNLIRV